MSRILETIFVNALWQLPLLAVTGLLAARVLRPFGPAAQYRLWLTVTALELLIPALSTFPKAWFQAATAWLKDPSSPQTALVTVLTGPATAVPQLHLPETLRQSAILLYLAITAFFTLRLLWRSIQLRTLRRRVTPIPLTPDLESLWFTCKSHFNTQATLVSAPGIFGPITVGLRAKLLILPDCMLETLPADELHAILAHEFAHMRRNDFATNLTLQVLTLPIAFHPALWLTRAHTLEAREVVCDHLAAAHTGRAAYTRSLLRLAARILTHSSTPYPHAIGVFDAHPLERRLMNLTHIPAPVGPTRRLALTAATLALATLTCGTALALRVNLNSTISQAESTPPKTLKVAAGDMAGNLQTKVMPVYPPDAKAAGIEGAVVLHAIIGKDGKSRLSMSSPAHPS